MPSQTNLPLRWESTGDEWWFASPIDIAAANGHYELVKHLLKLEPELLIKLTSLPRIQRLESIWDNDNNNNVAKNRSEIARKMLHDSETLTGQNSLIRAGYGGWLMYTAAYAGDLGFVEELLTRVPSLAFGGGEFKVTDLLYAAAKGRRREVFVKVFDCCCVCKEEEMEGLVKSEMRNRAAHAAARGGNLEILKEMLGDVLGLGFRDGFGSTLLHSGSARGQVEVVKYLISSYKNIITSSDNHGNTALHVAAYWGHLPVVEVLISAYPSSALLTNDHGDTFLHMAVAGFRTPGFRRLDRQIELMKKIVSGTVTNLEDIIDVRNKEGRTALHIAVIDNIQSDMVELLMSVWYLDVNIRDNDGNTPLDLLKKWPPSPSSEILIKRMISAGGISHHEDQTANKSLVSLDYSPGTSFRIPDEEIIAYTGIDDTYQSSCDITSNEYNFSGEIEHDDPMGDSKPSKHKRSVSMSLLKNLLLRWPRKNKARNTYSLDFGDNISVGSSKVSSGSRNRQVSLRKQFSRLSSVPNKDKFGSPLSNFSKSAWSSPLSYDNRNGETRFGKPELKRKHASFNLRSVNGYFCFGGQGLAVENSVTSPGQSGNRQSLVV